MEPATRDGLLLVAKSVVFVLGGIMVVSAALDLTVDGWSALAGGFLLVGAVLALTPLGFAFRDAVEAARRGER